jgi:hypothetical protein
MFFLVLPRNEIGALQRAQLVGLAVQQSGTVGAESHLDDHGALVRQRRKGPPKERDRIGRLSPVSQKMRVDQRSVRFSSR